jgi:DNA invertase Pin-like site-specific DNA recombinase
VWKLDRLGRSLRDLITMLDDLKRRGVKFRTLTEAIDTETPTGRAMSQMIGVLAELERSLISERTRAGVREEEEASSGADHQSPQTNRGGRTG